MFSSNDFTYKPKAKDKPVEFVTRAEFDELKDLVTGKSKAPKKAMVRLHRPFTPCLPMK